MSTLKLSTLIAPIPISTANSHKFDRLMRTLASPSNSTAIATAHQSIPLPATTTPHSLTLNSNSSSFGEKRLSLFPLRQGAMLCAQLGRAAHVKTPQIKLPFKNDDNYNKKVIVHSICPYSSASGERRGKKLSAAAAASSAPDSSSSSEVVSAALVTDSDNMGHESSRNGALWFDKDDIPSSSSKKHCERESSENDPSKLLTLPTILTLCRVVAVPVFVGTFYIDSWWGRAATTSIFVAAAITDWLDGYLARRMGLGTAFGAFLDPVADKLMVAATLVLFCSRPLEATMFGDVPWLFTVPAIAIIGREITMSAVREWAASQNSKLLEAVAVNNLGKWKTATQMTALTILLAARESSGGLLVGSGVVLLYISSGLAVWSLVVYTRKIGKVLLR